ncbi:MAG: CPBP family intramembrane metalloprotease [Clostridia bacterium]|nr:CPBP family intramembrane metalloprotease [Clostridia bacterium]
MERISSTEKTAKWNRPHLTAPLLVLFVLAAMHFSRFLLAGTENVTDLFLSISLVQILVLLVPCMLYYLLKKRKLATPMPVSPMKVRHIALTAFGGCVLIVGNLLIKFIYRAVAEQAVSTPAFFEGLSSGEGELPFAGVLLSMVIIPAVCEELLFRGVILAEYRSLGQGNAVVISAVCFAMLHFSVTNFPVYLFVGVLLGVITLASRSVIPAMLLHLLSNTLSVFTSDQFLNIIMQKNGAFFVGFLLAMLFGASLFLFLYCVELQYLRFAQEPPEQSLPPKNRTHIWKVFLSPAFLVLTAVFFLITAIQ